MPVVGLPTAAEAVLSSLLTTQWLSSWKAVGEGNATVVILRFQQDGRPPYHGSESSLGRWRRKAPSQVRRDQLRAQRHKQDGEKTTSVNVSSQTSPDVAANFENHIPAQAARENHASSLDADSQSPSSEGLHAAVSDVNTAEVDPVEELYFDTKEQNAAEPNRNPTREITWDLHQQLKAFAEDYRRAIDKTCEALRDRRVSSSACVLSSGEKYDRSPPTASILRGNSAEPPPETSYLAPPPTPWQAHGRMRNKADRHDSQRGKTSQR